MQPRLAADIGNLLLWLTGQSSIPAVDGTSGLNVHTFSQADGNPVFIPFGGVRRYVPGLNTSSDLGEIGIDCIVNSGTFNFPQVGPLSASFGILGREFLLDDAPDVWVAAATENYDSVPMVMKGSGIILPSWTPGGGASLPITSASVTLSNGTTTPQEERISGSYDPDDYAARQRVFGVQMVYKWSDPDLYRFIINNNDVSGNFMPCIETTDFELSAETPCDVNGGVTDFPWKIVFKAPKMDWQSQPLALEGDDILSMTFSGTALEADSGLPEDYFEIELHNEHAQYVIPA